MKKTVTSILRCYGRILIMKRSDKIRYYRGLWEGVSGHVEEDDIDEMAVTEIEEETGLKCSDLKLVKKGEPFVVKDSKIGTEFFVHSYLFDVETFRIEIDWEHTEYKWIDPKDIEDFECVPDFDKVLRRLGLIR